MSCLSVNGVPECGHHGVCVALDNKTEFCDCEPGWSQTREFSIYFVKDELSGLCILNPGLLSGIYGFIIFIAVVDTLAQLYICESRRQLEKRALWFGYSLLVVGTCMYRLINNEALFGVDLAFTIVFTISWIFPVSQGYFWLSKYLKYMAKKLIEYDRTSVITSRSLHGKLALNTYFYLMVFVGIVDQLFWISTVDVFIKDINISFILMKIVFWVNLIRALYQCVYVHITLSTLSSDMQRLIRSNEHGQIKISTDDKFVVWIKKRIPEISAFRIRSILSTAIDASFFVFALSWDFGFMLWTYLLPLSYLVLYFYSLAGVIDKWKWRKINKFRIQVSSFASSKELSTSKSHLSFTYNTSSKYVYDDSIAPVEDDES